MKRIPQKAAKSICETYGYDYAIIIGVRDADGAGAIATYGMTKAQCRKAGEIGEGQIAPLIFGEKVTDKAEMKELRKTPNV